MKRPELGQRRQKGDFRVGQFMIPNIQPTKRRMAGQVVEIPVVAAVCYYKYDRLMESHMIIRICNKESLQEERAWKEHAGKGNIRQRAPPSRAGCHRQARTHQHAAYMIGTRVTLAQCGQLSHRDAHTTESLTPNPGGGGGGRPGTTPSRTAPSAPSSRT